MAQTNLDRCHYDFVDLSSEVENCGFGVFEDSGKNGNVVMYKCQRGMR